MFVVVCLSAIQYEELNRAFKVFEVHTTSDLPVMSEFSLKSFICLFVSPSLLFLLFTHLYSARFVFCSLFFCYICEQQFILSGDTQALDLHICNLDNVLNDHTLCKLVPKKAKDVEILEMTICISYKHGIL